jgi:GNAT superfamily N-acetyltransferase
VLALAARVLAQERYLTWHFPDALESHVLGAYYGTRCDGFLRLLI